MNLFDAIKDSWNVDTAFAYESDYLDETFKKNPAFSQCVVSSLVVQDYLGGDLVKSDSPIHVWNIVDGEEVDLTREQFEEFKPSGVKKLDRKDALKIKETTEKRYKLLKKRVEGKLAK